jgi:hypothetical protein
MAPTTPDARQQAGEQSFGVNCFACAKRRVARRTSVRRCEQVKELDDPLKSGHDRTEAFDSGFLSRDDFADVVPKFLKRRGLVGLPIDLLNYLHQMIEVLRVVAAKPVSTAFLEKAFNVLVHLPFSPCSSPKAALPPVLLPMIPHFIVSTIAWTGGRGGYAEFICVNVKRVRSSNPAGATSFGAR